MVVLRLVRRVSFRSIASRLQTKHVSDVHIVSLCVHVASTCAGLYILDYIR